MDITGLKGRYAGHIPRTGCLILLIVVTYGGSPTACLISRIFSGRNGFSFHVFVMSSMAKGLRRMDSTFSTTICWNRTLGERQKAFDEPLYEFGNDMILI